MISSRLKQRLGVTVCLIMAVGFLFSLNVFSNFQVSLADNLYGSSASPNIIIVAIDDQSLQEIGRWPWNRENYVLLFENLSSAAVVGVDIAFFEPSTAEADAALIDAVKRAGNVIVPVEFVFEDGGIRVLKPISGLQDASLNVGYVNVSTDPDGISRSIPFQLSTEFVSLSEAIAEAFAQTDLAAPIGNRGLINFVGPASSFETISASDVIQNKFPPAYFKDKIVLLGATAADLHDNYFVPTSKSQAMPGVEMHANAVQMLLTQRFISDSPFWLTWILIALFSLLVFGLTLRFNLLVGAGSVIVLIIAYAFISIFVFSTGLILNLVHVVLSMLAVFIGNVGMAYFSERKEKAHITNAFGKYVSPTIVNELLKHPEKLNLGGDSREITVFFSDIRSFTSFSEKMSPADLVKFLNDYLSAMTEIILKKNGLVDKYIGDAIMAFWNAPLDEPLHAKLACESCLEMQAELNQLREAWVQKGLPEIKVGMGLNSGEAVVGNMGSSNRFDYTAMGDSVNLGSRLESLTKQYGVSILVSKSVFEKVSNEFVFRRIDFVKVKGKQQAIEIFELIGKEISSKQKEFVSAYEKGLDLYLARQWKEATAQFKKSSSLQPDKASELMVERCQFFAKHLPAKDWDGSFELKSK